MLTWIALALFAAALILLVIHRRQRARGGLPSGEIVYSDVAAQDVPVLIFASIWIERQTRCVGPYSFRRFNPCRAQEIAGSKAALRGRSDPSNRLLRAGGGTLRSDSAVYADSICRPLV
jgi:hypothetical protein